MTVCIAAICRDEQDRPAIVGASDRMISTPDYQYEPKQPKIFPLADSCIVFVAGANADLAGTLRGAEKLLRERPAEMVSSIAQAVGDAYVGYQQQCIEGRVLAKYGLTYQAFHSQSSTLSPTLIHEIVSDIRDTELNAEVLVAGLDQDDGSAHLFRVRTGVPESEDAAGFAAIGWGEPVAEAHFMMWEYTRYHSMAEALWRCYCAKRAAEVVPSVGGRATDLFRVDREHGRHQFSEHAVDELNRAYRRVRNGERKRHEKVIKQVAGFLSDQATPHPPDAARSVGARSTPDSSAPPPSPGSDEPPSLAS